LLGAVQQHSLSRPGAARLPHPLVRAEPAIPETTVVELKGWKALAVLGLLLVVAAFRYHSRAVTLQTEGRDAVRSWVVAGYVRSALVPQGLAPELDSAAATELLRQSGVEIRSMTARGWSDNVVVRVELSVNGGPPADGRPVRYFRLLHLAYSGWRVVGESSALRYYTRLW
jgi:hypothetical protein